MIVVFGLYFQQQWMFLFLAIDFLMRTLGLSISPLTKLSESFAKIFHFERKPIFAAPKRFSAFLGFVMTSLISVFYSEEIGIIIGFVFVVMCTIESVFKFCIGCCIYNYLILPFRKKIKFQITNK